MMRRCVSSPTSNSQASRSRSTLMQHELLSPVSAPSTAPPTSVNTRPERLACTHTKSSKLRQYVSTCQPNSGSTANQYCLGNTNTNGEAVWNASYHLSGPTTCAPASKCYPSCRSVSNIDRSSAHTQVLQSASSCSSCAPIHSTLTLSTKSFSWSVNAVIQSTS